MSLLSVHLEQIALCSQSIAALHFPPPQIFTNALLAPHDITALIRDTEPHERALFSVPPPPAPNTAQYQEPKTSTSSRRQTVFNVTSGEVTSSSSTARAPRRNTAVAAVLGADLNSEVKRNENLQKGDIDVEVLLQGAEKLGEVFVMDGAKEKIAAMRLRYSRLRTSLTHYEAKVARQTRELEKMNKPADWEGDNEDEEALEPEDHEQGAVVTDEDLRQEEEEIRELERRKKELEDRVSGMERDLGGLLR